MLSVNAMTLLIVVMLLIIASFLVAVWLEKRRFKRILASEVRTPSYVAQRPSNMLERQFAAVQPLQSPGRSNLTGSTETKHQALFTLPATWYNRRRSIVSLGFLLMVFSTLFVQSELSGGTTIRSITRGLDLSFLTKSAPSDTHEIAHPIVLTASARVVRINSADRNQYYTDYQWQTWSYSSCSGIAMAMVMNSYGRHVIAADVLQEEANTGVWNVDLGLLQDDGIAMTAAYFGFASDTSHSRTVQDIVATANRGQPVIVSVRDSYYFPGGHIFVVRGGDGQSVYIADSSPGNFQRMSYAMFQGMWQGLSVVLTPRNQ